ncbi:MAG TPA: six-cysteine peptide SCIFF [Tissierellia bacterium]|nr:six-cysteine peptide SCIFF [Tissierellia bacterium]
MKKHVKTVYIGKQEADKVACGECQTSCQSACKTSCTVGNQGCEQK